MPLNMVGAVAALSIVRPAAIDVVHESIILGELQQRMTTVNGCHASHPHTRTGLGSIPLSTGYLDVCIAVGLIKW